MSVVVRVSDDFDEWVRSFKGCSYRDALKQIKEKYIQTFTNHEITNKQLSKQISDEIDTAKQEIKDEIRSLKNY